MQELQQKMLRAANRLAKWRSLLAGWQVGTRPKGDPEADAIRDHREVTLLLRAEVSALTRLLLENTSVTQEQLLKAFTEEYEMLDKDLENRFPGAKSSDEGMVFDKRAMEWMSEFPT